VNFLTHSKLFTLGNACLQLLAKEGLKQRWHIYLSNVNLLFKLWALMQVDFSLWESRNQERLSNFLTYPSSYLTIYSFTHSSTYSSMNIPIHPSILLPIHLFIHLSTHSSIYSSTNTPIHLSIHSIHRSICFLTTPPTTNTYIQK
jgi:hypothetical protein